MMAVGRGGAPERGTADTNDLKREMGKIEEAIVVEGLIIIQPVPTKGAHLWPVDKGRPWQRPYMCCVNPVTALSLCSKYF